MNFHLQQIQKGSGYREIDIQASAQLKNRTFCFENKYNIFKGVLFQDHFLIWQKMMNSGFEGKTT